MRTELHEYGGDESDGGGYCPYGRPSTWRQFVRLPVGTAQNLCASYRLRAVGGEFARFAADVMFKRTTLADALVSKLPQNYASLSCGRMPQ